LLWIAVHEEDAGLLIVPLDAEDTSMHVSPGWVAPGYGDKAPSFLVRYQRDVELPSRYLTLLYPYAVFPGDGELESTLEQALALVARADHSLGGAGA
jgi:hypothetical protein